MTEEKKVRNVTGESVKDSEPKKKKPRLNSSMGGMKMWWAILFVYLLIFGYVGYIAFWPMAFNDPDNTVGKYMTILNKYAAEKKKLEAESAGTTTPASAAPGSATPVEILKTGEELQFKEAMEELMKKAEESAGDMQQLASQSFNIVLGAFLAFLSATVTMIFQSNKKEEEEPEPEDEEETA